MDTAAFIALPVQDRPKFMSDFIKRFILKGRSLDVFTFDVIHLLDNSKPQDGILVRFVRHCDAMDVLNCAKNLKDVNEKLKRDGKPLYIVQQHAAPSTTRDMKYMFFLKHKLAEILKAPAEDIQVRSTKSGLAIMSFKTPTGRTTLTLDKLLEEFPVLQEKYPQRTNATATKPNSDVATTAATAPPPAPAPAVLATVPPPAPAPALLAVAPLGASAAPTSIQPPPVVEPLTGMVIDNNNTPPSGSRLPLPQRQPNQRRTNDDGGRYGGNKDKPNYNRERQGPYDKNRKGGGRDAWGNGRGYR